jgi:hypothetical protein
LQSVRERAVIASGMVALLKNIPQVSVKDENTLSATKSLPGVGITQLLT